MTERHKVPAGYYAMALYDAYTDLADMIKDEQVRVAVQAVLDSSPSALATVEVDGNSGCFYVFRRLPWGGIVVFLSALAGRRDTAAAALQAMEEAVPEAKAPLAVAWLQTHELVMH